MTALDLLVQKCESARQRLFALGVELVVTEVDVPPKPGVRVDATSSRGLAQIGLWITGEMDIVIADLRSGDIVVNEHRSAMTTADMASALDLVEHHLAIPDQPVDSGPHD